VGDSRCYRWRGQELLQITKDHSFLQEQLDAGLLTPEQAAQSPNRNLVTRALGVEEDVLLELHSHLVEAGDLYLMCSDGLSDMVSDEMIANILHNGSSLTEMAAELVSVANQQGGRDNIAVLLTQVAVPLEKRGLIARWLGKH
jgi:serine/threonine protein phosphatase PrpC